MHKFRSQGWLIGVALPKLDSCLQWAWVALYISYSQQSQNLGSGQHVWFQSVLLGEQGWAVHHRVAVLYIYDQTFASRKNEKVARHNKCRGIAHSIRQRIVDGGFPEEVHALSQAVSCRVVLCLEVGMRVYL